MSRKRRIETADEPILAFDLWVHHGTVLQGRKHDLRSERQRRDDGPRSQRAVIRTIRHASREIPMEAPCDAFYSTCRWPRAVTRRDAPGVLAIATEALRISNGVLFSPMHSFRGKLTDQQMLDVLSYIRSMAPFDTVS